MVTAAVDIVNPVSLTCDMSINYATFLVECAAEIIVTQLRFIW